MLPTFRWSIRLQIGVQCFYVKLVAPTPRLHGVTNQKDIYYKSLPQQNPSDLCDVLGCTYVKSRPWRRLTHGRMPVHYLKVCDDHYPSFEVLRTRLSSYVIRRKVRFLFHAHRLFPGWPRNFRYSHRQWAPLKPVKWVRGLSSSTSKWAELEVHTPV